MRAIEGSVVGRRPTLVAATVLTVALVCLLAVSGIGHGHRNTGDSGNLVVGTRLALDCVADLDLVACGNVPGASWTGVFPYPALQYLPTAGLVELGLSDSGVLLGLSWVSLLSFIAVLGFAVLAGRRLQWRGWAPLLVLAMVVSPLVYQSTSAFGEMFAAAVLLGAVVAALYRRPVLLGLGAFAAPLGKETLLPFAVLLLVLAAREEDDGWLPRAGLALPIAIGGSLSLIVTFGLNVFRYGTPRNLLYLRPLLQTPGAGRKAEFTGAIWLSPNGGMAWYWPVATIILAGTAVVAVRRLLQGGGRRSWLPPAVVCATVALFSLGLGAWFAPFGWISYGTRLMVPFVPAAVVTAVVVAEPELTSAARRVVRGWSALLIAAALAVLAFPQARAAWSYPAALLTIVAPDSTCVTIGPIEDDPAEYFRCMSNTMWRLHPSMLRAVTTSGPQVGLVGGLLGSALAGSLVLAARAIDEEERPRRTGGHPRKVGSLADGPV